MATTKTPRILVLGSLSIDFVSRVPHHPLPGETLTATSFSLSPGGKGANQATAIAKLSRTQGTLAFGPGEAASVTMAGAVGDDAYGPMLVDNLQSFGVDTSALKVRGRPGQGGHAKSGIAIIWVDEPTGENRIVLSPEANATVLPGPEFTTLEAMSSTASPTGGGKPDLLVMQLEVPLPTVLEALRTARENAIPVLFNPAPALAALPLDAYEGLAHLVVNETEAAILSGQDVSVLDTESGLSSTADVFLTRGCKNVVITLGARGTYYANSRKRGLVPAEKAKVVDTTAAGDTFVGTYALDVVGAGGTTFDIAAAVGKANKAAKITVERPGAQASIPWRDELGGIQV